MKNLELYSKNYTKYPIESLSMIDKTVYAAIE